MCGLVGIIGKYSNGFSSLDVDIFKDLLFMDALRGEDATGIALVDNDNEVTILKDAIPSWEFLAEDSWKAARIGAVARGRALLGHNRKKTIGSNKAENAHPFVVNKDKVFFHNGTLQSHEKLHKTEVDSEALGIHLSECGGNKSKLEEALRQVKGAFACVWYDQSLHKVFFLRNKERNLAYGISKSGPIIYASEPQMIYAAANRNRTVLETIETFEEDTLYSLDLAITSPAFVKEKLSFFPLPSHTTTDGRLSKNMFKRMVETLPKRIQFFIDGTSISHDRSSLVIFGENEDFPKTLIRAKIKRRGLTNGKSFDDILKNRVASGTVLHTNFNKDTGTAIIDLGTVALPKTFYENTVEIDETALS